MQARAREGGSGLVLFRLRDATGVYRWYENTSNTLTMSDGTRRIVTVSRDVTERRELEEQLRQSQKMEALGQLAGGVAHDFNNLLTIIGGASEAVLDQLPEDSTTRQDVQMILDAADRAAGLTWQLLAFSRHQHYEPGALDLGDVVLEMRDMIGRLIGVEVEFNVEVAPGLFSVLADRGQMEQAVMNLVVNARDAMPEGGSLTIEVRNVAEAEELQVIPGSGQPSGPHVSLSVRDNGIGMSEAVISRIFDPFFTTKEVGRGTGLGLATVYRIVEQARGHLTVDSTPGKGTKIGVLLPRLEQSPSVSPEATPPEPRGGRETILLVDAEVDVRDLLGRQLERLGYRLLVAADTDAALALALAEPQPIDLLMTDIAMPGRSGLELATELLALKPHTQVLFISGHAGEPPAGSLLEPDRNLLTKPFRNDVLADKVREILDGARNATRE